MDIKKIQEIVEKSDMTDEAKDLIYKLLPEADKPEVAGEILRIIDFEIEMNQAVADEAEEIMDMIDDGDEMMVGVEKSADQRIDQIKGAADEKFADVEADKAEIDKEEVAPEQPQETSTQVPPVVAPVASEPVSAPAQTYQPAPQWSQPAEPVQPVQPATQPAPFPASPVTQ